MLKIVCGLALTFIAIVPLSVDVKESGIDFDTYFDSKCGGTKLLRIGTSRGNACSVHGEHKLNCPFTNQTSSLGLWP